MFTVCPKCALTLVVTAQDLRVAQGYVRCGRCSNVFNALARLSEDRNAAAANPAAQTPPAAAPTNAPPRAAQPETSPTPSAPKTPAETPARPPQTTGSFTYARPPTPTPPAPPAGSRPPLAPFDSDDADSIPEDALEFNPAAADVNQVFVEPPPNPEWTAATGTFKSIILKSEASGLSAEIELDPDFLSSTAEMRKLKLGLGESDAAARPGGDQSNITDNAAGRAAEAPSQQSRATPPQARTPAAGAHPPATGQTPAAATNRAAPPRNPTSEPQPQVHAFLSPRAPSEPDEPDAPQVATRASPHKTIRAFGLDSVEPPTEGLASLARARIAPGTVEPPVSRNLQLLVNSPLLWRAGGAALVILLLAQIVNHYRNDLAATATFNKPITALYSAFGVRLTPRWDLRAYDVRQLGASVDAESAGRIMVRASVKNGGHQAQPMPLLRVTLQDRFGNRIAARDVAPGNYLPHAIPATSFLAAGQRVDAEMAFVDPGSNAVGFEIDACLPAPAGGIACANDTAQ